MLFPALYNDKMFDDFFGFPFEKTSNTFGRFSNVMHTDIKETDECFNLKIDLPGFAKEDITGEVHDGYLTVKASNTKNEEEKDAEGKFIRRERYSGCCSRTFYVGKTVTDADIRAKFKDGVLELCIPKKDMKAVEKPTQICIE